MAEGCRQAGAGDMTAGQNEYRMTKEKFLDGILVLILMLGSNLFIGLEMRQDLRFV